MAWSDAARRAAAEARKRRATALKERYKHGASSDTLRTSKQYAAGPKGTVAQQMGSARFKAEQKAWNDHKLMNAHKRNVAAHRRRSWS